MQVSPHFSGTFVIQKKDPNSNTLALWTHLRPGGSLYEQGVEYGFGGEGPDQVLLIWGASQHKENAIRQILKQFDVNIRYTDALPAYSQTESYSSMGAPNYSAAYVQTLLQKSGAEPSAE